jgi:pyridoxamine 5'-phosphate oxidase
MDIAALRKSYEQGELDEAHCAADPLVQFQLWLDQALAAKLPEPNAMTLATVGANGRPSTRVVLIKGLDARGLVWYTNYDSRKGQELAGSPFAALQFHWVELERVVRIEGRVEKTAPEQSDAYFDTRPLASRISAVASPQSRVVGSRAVLEAATQEANARYGAQPVRPAHWGGYRLAPERWEFWQGRRSRLHDRISYRLAAHPPAGAAAPEDLWVRERLAP